MCVACGGTKRRNNEFINNNYCWHEQLFTIHRYSTIIVIKDGLHRDVDNNTKKKAYNGLGMNVCVVCFRLTNATDVCACLHCMLCVYVGWEISVRVASNAWINFAFQLSISLSLPFTHTIHALTRSLEVQSSINSNGSEIRADRMDGVRGVEESALAEHADRRKIIPTDMVSYEHINVCVFLSKKMCESIFKQNNRKICQNFSVTRCDARKLLHITYNEHSKRMKCCIHDFTSSYSIKQAKKKRQNENELRYSSTV